MLKNIKLNSNDTFFPGNCFSQQRVDYRLDYSTADELTEASSKEDCERHCINSYKFECRGFAYRFMSSPYRNCELSGKNIRSIGQFELDYALGMDNSIIWS